MDKINQNEIIMTRDEVRAFDSYAINTLGIPGVVLMENAGRTCVETIIQELRNIASPKVCIFCGTGNNGGDGYVIARHLLNNKFEVTVIVCGDKNKIKGDAKTNLDILERMGESIEYINLLEDNIDERTAILMNGAYMIVDALFGTGLSGCLRDEHIHLIENINKAKCPILAVDIPSGMDCDTGESLGVVVKADYTVTFVAMKKGFKNANSIRYAGKVVVASIGIVPD